MSHVDSVWYIYGAAWNFNEDYFLLISFSRDTEILTCNLSKPSVLFQKYYMMWLVLWYDTLKFTTNMLSLLLETCGMLYQNMIFFLKKTNIVRYTLFSSYFFLRHISIFWGNKSLVMSSNHHLDFFVK